jgi:hypothetical protein
MSDWFQRNDCDTLARRKLGRSGGAFKPFRSQMKIILWKLVEGEIVDLCFRPHANRKQIKDHRDFGNC